MKQVFIANLGTTSFKFKLFCKNERQLRVLASGELESIGAPESRYSLEYADGQKKTGSAVLADHGVGFSFCLDALQSDGILNDLRELDAVGYKAVHGGRLTGTRMVDDVLLEEMERMTPLAPAHNTIYLAAMRQVRKRYPALRQVARFETSFHASIPEYRTVYGVPYQWYEQWGVRRYGFHGSSHEYIAGRTAQLLPQARKVISCHLGGSSSICAILDGKSVAASMGATPQSGLFHNNRVGDFDVFCLPLLLEYEPEGLSRVLRTLSKESGLLGLSGVSNDLRLVMEAMDEGNARAKLAADALADNIVGYIGMFTAYLHGLDALVFTGGIGANSDRLRSMVCSSLNYLGLELDAARNRNQEQIISSDCSRVTVLRLKTDEELVVAKNVLELLERSDAEI